MSDHERKTLLDAVRVLAHAELGDDDNEIHAAIVAKELADVISRADEREEAPVAPY